MRYRGAFVKCVGVGVNVCVCVCVCERVRECWFVVFGRSRHTCVCMCVCMCVCVCVYVCSAYFILLQL